MKNKGVNFSEKVRNVLLAEPLTTKGQSALEFLERQLSENDFLEKMYVEPFTIYNQYTDETADSDADPDLDYAKRIDLNYLIHIKEGFETQISKLSDSLFVIMGGAGSGKTTYIHHLKTENENNIEFHFCDFERTKSSISILGKAFDFGDMYDSNVWKFISNIIDHIFNILKIDEFNNVNEHIEFITSIVNIYHNNFVILNGRHTVVDTDEIRDFFSLLQKYADESINYNDFGNCVGEILKNKFDIYEKTDKRRKAITYVIGILIRIFFCLYQINNKKHIGVIDNIEYFVPYDELHPIQECELQTIFVGVLDAINETRSRISELKKINKSLESFYAFVLVTRNTSVTLTELHQYDDFTRESVIDITGWFLAEEIYSKKMDYFKDIVNSFEMDPYLKAYNNIMSDMSLYNWGLH